jgi:hypothetical protein
MRTSIATSFTLAALLSIPQAAIACRCSGSPDTPTYFQNADIVVAAEALEVTDIKRIESQNGQALNFTDQKVTWKIFEAWKGPLKKHHRLTTISPLNNCTPNVKPRSKMLLYLPGSEPRVISACRGSTPFNYSLEEIPILNRLRIERGNGT